VKGGCKLQLVEAGSLKGIFVTRKVVYALIQEKVLRSRASRWLRTWRTSEGRTEALCEDNAKHNAKGEIRAQRNNAPGFCTATRGVSKDRICQ